MRSLPGPFRTVKAPAILRWPYPYRWAFGITDDTDGATLEKVEAFYEFCLARDIWPTKTVWTHRPMRSSGNLQRPPNAGITLEDDAYRAYCQQLAQRGVEMALHGVTSGNNERADVIRGFERFEQVFGHVPSMYICHLRNREHPYWGENQFSSPLLKAFVRRFTEAGRHTYSGEDPASPYYWTDICWQKVKYVRLFRTVDFNVLKHNPHMPFHQEDKPDVRMIVMS